MSRTPLAVVPLCDPLEVLSRKLVDTDVINCQLPQVLLFTFCYGLGQQIFSGCKARILVPVKQA